MGTLPPRARKRLRVIDADTPDLETIDPTTLEFDDENRLCVVETVLALENSAEREAAIEERRRAYRKSYVLLKPSALAAYHAMSDALRGCEDELARRLGSTRSDLLLMSVRMPDDIWSDAFHAALKTLVPFITISHPGVDASFTVAIPQSERWQGTEYAFQPEPIMRELMKQHVVMLHGPGVDVPSTLSSLVDVSIDLADMPARYLELAIVRSFELDEPKIWLGPDVNRLKPSLFDAACARAPDWTEVAPILNRLARAELDEEAIAAKAKEKDEKKPSTSASKTAFVPEVLHPTEPTLDRLSGYGAFAEWSKDAARDVADYRAGRLSWADVDVGCLLHGPPGTGKTFAARAFAATCGLPFMPVSYGQWTASGRSYQGDVIAAMRATFAAASALSPCVLFIDEVDSIPNREKVREYGDYWIPIVNAKLELLDGTAGRPGVIVIAACNDPTRLDPALIRSGRLDRHFRLSLPDEPSLLGMLGYHLPGVDTAALAPAATVLAGSASAADVARYAREARRAARRQSREVTAEDLLSIAMPVDTMSSRDRRLVAVHEAGHAVVAMDFGRMPGALSIVSADGAHGGVRLGSDIGMGRLSDFEAEAIISLAGRAAEEVILGEPSAGAEVDLQSATALVLQMIGTTGLGGRLTHGDRVDAAAVEGRLRDLYSRAVRLVGEHRKAVESLADLAIERRVLGRAALVEFAREHGFGGRV